jgi:3-hydroxyisobutyrate dehydrogenase
MTRTGRAATELAQELGSFASQSLGEVAAAADVIITVVTDDAAMRQIYSAAGDNLLVNAKGKLFINCATISPEVHLEVEDWAQKAGAQSLEACMASSIPQARDGSLYLMCGGEKSAFDRAEPILQSLGKTIRYIGQTGQAAKVKALVNMVMNINTAGLAEGLGLVTPSGSISTCCGKFSPKPAPARGSCKPTAKTCRTAITPASSPPRMRRRTAGLRCTWRERRPRAAARPATKEQYDRMVKEGIRRAG